MKIKIIQQLNTKNQSYFDSQCGQATMEFVSMLIGLIALILGIIFVSGLSLSSNKMLMSARNNAEKLSRYSSFNVGARGSEYGSWTRPKIDLYNDNNALSIPFSLSDKVSHIGDNSITNSFDALDNSQFSVDRSIDPNDKNSVSTKLYQYNHWIGPNKFNNALNNDFFNTATTSNARDAARLVQGKHDNNIALVDILSSHDQQNASFNKSSNAAQALYDTFENLVGVRLNKKKLDNSITNRVYMPIVKNTNDEIGDSDN